MSRELLSEAKELEQALHAMQIADMPSVDPIIANVIVARLRHVVQTVHE